MFSQGIICVGRFEPLSTPLILKGAKTAISSLGLHEAHVLVITDVSLLTTFKQCLAGALVERTYLAVVPVESLELLDVRHADALGQRVSAQVSRRKRRQGVRCICIKRRGKCSEWSLLGLWKDAHEGQKRIKFCWEMYKLEQLKFETGSAGDQPQSVPMYCWWCWLWAATDCSGVLLQCWELPHRLSDMPSTFWRGLNLKKRKKRRVVCRW